MRVFVSSTVYDLLDIRAHIANMLRSLKIQPVLSDDKLSDFELRHDANSIETCLVNVESSDYVIVLLDKRYGPPLGAAGFEDVSATHLEYRRAIEKRIPVLFYLRDRLLADYSIWRKNEKNGKMNYQWASTDADCRLFKFIEERQRLESTSTNSNWYMTFSTSVDLLESIRNQLEASILPEMLTEAICSNSFPLLTIESDCEVANSGPGITCAFRLWIRNMGGAIAFNIRTTCESDDSKLTEVGTAPPRILCHGAQFTKQFCVYLGSEVTTWNEVMHVEYETAIGVLVSETYDLTISTTRLSASRVTTNGATLRRRTFRRIPRFRVEIED